MTAWTKAEDAILSARWNAGHPVEDIAAQLGRSFNAIRDRRKRLKLPARDTAAQLAAWNRLQSAQKVARAQRPDGDPLSLRRIGFENRDAFRAHARQSLGRDDFAACLALAAQIASERATA